MRFLLPVGAGLAVVLSAPFMGELRRWIRQAFPGQFVAIVSVALAIAAAALVLTALLRIRERRRERYGLLAAAVMLAIGYARWSALGIPDSDVVERVHFVEYGLVTWLFYRAWHRHGRWAPALTFLSAMTVGTCEEWFQWLIPARVGEVRDVALNSAAIVCGLLASVAIRPLAPSRVPSAQSGASLATTAAVAAAMLAGFVDSAHLGHVVQDGEGPSFRSIYSAEELTACDLARRREWTTSPQLVRPARLSREDQFASEGHLHVQARNEAWGRGDVRTAWYENQILERWFSSVLDAPSYVSATGHRWGVEQRADAERRVAAVATPPLPFVSRAEGAFPIWTWPRTSSRLVVLAICVGLLGVAWAIHRQRPV